MANALKVREQFQNQSAVHEMLGNVLVKMEERAQEELGHGFVEDWAWENPGSFIKLIAGSTPSIAPVSAVQGDVVLHVHPTLAPTDLDIVSDQ